VARLERVVGDLESGQLTLEQSIEKFAEGVRLAKDASKKLDDAERRVELLVRGVDGEDEAVPFDPGGSPKGGAP
jgi:exodeoxyribonuclease VII small subunit